MALQAAEPWPLPWVERKLIQLHVEARNLLEKWENVRDRNDEYFKDGQGAKLIHSRDELLHHALEASRGLDDGSWEILETVDWTRFDNTYKHVTVQQARDAVPELIQALQATVVTRAQRKKDQPQPFSSVLVWDIAT